MCPLIWRRFSLSHRQRQLRHAFVRGAHSQVLLTYTREKTTKSKFGIILVLYAAFNLKESEVKEIRLYGFNVSNQGTEVVLLLGLLSEKSWKERDGKIHEPLFHLIGHYDTEDCYYKAIDSELLVGKAEQCFLVPGPVIVGAGPSGLAVAACLKEKGIPSLILERSHCIASLWQLKAYDRLCLHLPKRFCELPHMPFPACFSAYPTKEEFVRYLEVYARRFSIRPVFNSTVMSAKFDKQIELWRVKTMDMEGRVLEYVSRWLIAATGANAEEVVPNIDGMREFGGPIIHTSSYKSGRIFGGQRVLVVGCGNSGMEVCLDLCDHNARPSMVVRQGVHVLPREILGWSTFGLSTWLLKLLPVRMVDRLLLLVSRLMLGNTEQHGLRRPRVGPLELKFLSGKTPVLDVGALAKIKSGEIQVLPAVKRLTSHGAEFVDGREEDFDAVILATGYQSNVRTWLKDGLPRGSLCNYWKWERGLYSIGFSPRGLMGSSIDAGRIAADIALCWNAEAKQPSPVP